MQESLICFFLISDEEISEEMLRRATNMKNYKRLDLVSLALDQNTTLSKPTSPEALFVTRRMEEGRESALKGTNETNQMTNDRNSATTLYSLVSRQRF